MKYPVLTRLREYVIFDKSRVLILHRFLVVFLQSIYHNYTLQLLRWYFNCLFILALQISWAYCAVYFVYHLLCQCRVGLPLSISSVIGWMSLWVPAINGWWKPLSQPTVLFLFLVLCHLSQGLCFYHFCTPSRVFEGFFKGFWRIAFSSSRPVTLKASPEPCSFALGTCWVLHIWRGRSGSGAQPVGAEPASISSVLFL